jgi:hypothetical protein
VAKKTAAKNSRKRPASASTKRTSTKRAKAAKRSLVSPKGDKRYVRRSSAGQFSESDDVGKALTSDRRRAAKRKTGKGQGDKGDR